MSRCGTTAMAVPMEIQARKCGAYFCVRTAYASLSGRDISSFIVIASCRRSQASRAQEVVVGRRIHLDTLQTFRVHQHVVEIPEIDVWQVIGQDLLHLVIDSFALLLVKGRTAFADERINFGVGIECAIGALGWKASRVEYVLEEVRVLVSADPAHRVHLIGALGDVAKERRELEGANVERDASLAQLLLEHGGEQA